MQMRRGMVVVHIQAFIEFECVRLSCNLARAFQHCPLTTCGVPFVWLQVLLACLLCRGDIVCGLMGVLW